MMNSKNSSLPPKPKFKMVNSVARATGILLSLSEGVSRISDIANRLNLSVGTVYRFLKTLEALGLVVQDPKTRQYYLGYLVVKLAANPNIAYKTLILCSFEEMNRLEKINGETVVLHILVGAQPIRLQERLSIQDLRFTTWSKWSEPLYSGSMGKLFLSGMKDGELDILLKDMELVPFTPTTITDKESLMGELKKIRQQGYATSYGERNEGALAISVPVKNYVFPAALTIIGPEARMKPDLDSLIQEMFNSANRISHNLISRNILEEEWTKRIINT
jgi:DNA-binding IclR family transcriptional regulator